VHVSLEPGCTVVLAITLKDQFGDRDVTPKTAKLVCAPATPTAVTTTTTSTCPPATAAYCGGAGCGEGGMSGCPPLPALCPSGTSCTTTGATCACIGESIPCGDPRLSGDLQLLQVGHLPAGDDVWWRSEERRVRLRLRLPLNDT
jgi:hypothetical protein